MANMDLDMNGSPMKYGGGKIELNSPSDEERSMETMP
jgi:hypothetical protein